jgi:hypothetical protein
LLPELSWFALPVSVEQCFRSDGRQGHEAEVAQLQDPVDVIIASNFAGSGKRLRPQLQTSGTTKGATTKSRRIKSAMPNVISGIRARAFAAN